MLVTSANCGNWGSRKSFFLVSVFVLFFWLWEFFNVVQSVAYQSICSSLWSVCVNVSHGFPITYHVSIPFLLLIYTLTPSEVTAQAPRYPFKSSLRCFWCFKSVIQKVEYLCRGQFKNLNLPRTCKILVLIYNLSVFLFLEQIKSVSFFFSFNCLYYDTMDPFSPMAVNVMLKC